MQSKQYNRHKLHLAECNKAQCILDLHYFVVLGLGMAGLKGRLEQVRKIQYVSVFEFLNLVHRNLLLQKYMYSNCSTHQ